MVMPEILQEKLFHSKTGAYESIKSFAQRLSSLSLDVDKALGDFLSLLRLQPVKQQRGIQFF